MSKLSRRQALKAVAAAGAVTGCLPSSRTKEARARCKARTRRRRTRSSRSRRWASPGRPLDPFLFCVHHDDRYPAGNERHGPRGVAGGPQPGPGLRGQGRLAHVPRRGRAGLPAAPAPRLRDGDRRAPRAARSLRFARRGRALRRRRRAVADRRAAASCTPRCSRCSSASATNPLELFQIWLNLPIRRQDGRPVLLDVVEPDHPEARRPRRRRARRPRSR